MNLVFTIRLIVCAGAPAFCFLWGWWPVTWWPVGLPGTQGEPGIPIEEPVCLFCRSTFLKGLSAQIFSEHHQVSIVSHGNVLARNLGSTKNHLYSGDSETAHYILELSCECWLPVSCILYPVSCILYPVSSILYPVSHLIVFVGQLLRAHLG